MLWLTNSTVLPLRRETSSIFPRHFFWNSASPTARTSSTTRISGSRCAATANARRTYIPLLITFDWRIEEFLHFGKGNDLVEFFSNLSSRHAEDRTVEKNVFAAAQLRVKSCTHLEQARHTARRPSLAPRLGSVIRLRIFSNVLLPAPLRPMMPRISPCLTSKFTSFRAQSSSTSSP